MVAANRITSIGIEKKFIFLFVVLTGFFLGVTPFCARAQGNDMVLELKDVQFFRALEKNSSPVEIELSGLAFHSSMAVNKITTLYEGDSLHLIVHLAPATGNMSGNFKYTLAVPAQINTVGFGNAKAIVWRRGSGVMQDK